MNPFKNYTYSWWQIGIFKISMISLGAVLGSFWAETINELRVPLLVIFAITTAYIMYVSFKEK